MDENEQKIHAYGLLFRREKIKFAHLLEPYTWPLVYGCALLFLTNVIAAILPILINGGVSLIEKNLSFTIKIFSVNFNFLTIWSVLLAVLVLALIGAMLRTFSRKVLFDVGRTIERDVRAKLFFHITAVDDKFFLQHSVGDLMNHLTTDMTNVRMVSGFAALNIMNIIFVFCLSVPLLLKIDVVLGMCALLPFPLIIIATSSITKKMFLRTIEYQKQLSKMVGHVQENLLGAHIVRLFHQQQQENQRFLQTINETYDAGVRLAKVRVLMLPIMRLMVGIAVGLVLFLGGLAILSRRITLGDFVEINARILQLAWPAMSVGFVMSIYSRGQASLSRINDLLSYIPIIKDGDRMIDDVKKIELRTLYVPSKNKTSAPISFSIHRGQLLGVVGTTGSYKTHLLKMLYRRIEVPFGSIFLDEHDINTISLSSICHLIAVVSQESFLFHKSIRDNICFARPDASADEVLRVVKLVRLDRDCANFENGIDTIVGERGVTLSGGQRQRVVLARALLSRRPVIILDDALSSVDAETQRHIVTHLRDFLRDSIIIIATHRLSVIRDADEILVMQYGSVLEHGTHSHLMKHGVLYQQLWGFEELRGLWS